MECLAWQIGQEEYEGILCFQEAPIIQDSTSVSKLSIHLLCSAYVTSSPPRVSIMTSLFYVLQISEKISYCSHEFCDDDDVSCGEQQHWTAYHQQERQPFGSSLLLPYTKPFTTEQQHTAVHT